MALMYILGPPMGECDIGYEGEWTGAVCGHTCTGISVFGEQGSASGLNGKIAIVFFRPYKSGVVIVFEVRGSSISDTKKEEIRKPETEVKVIKIL
ncbi:hypothetical protein Tco_1409927 [Tanacetum coccineum]